MNLRFPLLLLAAATPLFAAPAHDLYLCATANKDYIVGAKLNTANGVLQRGPDDTYQPIGTNFPGIFDLVVDPRDPRVRYMATLNGCFVTTDGDQTRRMATDWSVTETHGICLDSHNPDHVYLATPDGIVVSVDRGAHWVRREAGLPERGKYTQVVTSDRTTGHRIFAGLEKGIFLTTDGAAHWRCVFPTERTVVDIRQSPHDPSLWLAATEGDGLVRSRDNGLTWERIATQIPNQPVYNVAFDATNPRRLAFSSWMNGVCTSEDGGTTWITRNAGLPPDGHVFRVAIDPDTGRLYANVHHDFIYTSTDFGRTWVKQSLAGAIVYNFVFVPKP